MTRPSCAACWEGVMAAMGAAARVAVRLRGSGRAGLDVDGPNWWSALYRAIAKGEQA